MIISSSVYLGTIGCHKALRPVPVPNRGTDKSPEKPDDEKQGGERQHVLQHRLSPSHPHGHDLIIPQNTYLCRQNEWRPRMKKTAMGRITAGIAGNHPFFASTIMRIVRP